MYIETNIDLDPLHPLHPQALISSKALENM